MALVRCRECQRQVSDSARSCPHCGVPYPGREEGVGTGYEWKSPWTIYGYPVIHIAYGRDGFGKMRVAKGVIAIGQFAVGYYALATIGFAPHLWTINHKDVEAVRFFSQLWEKVKEILPFLENL